MNWYLRVLSKYAEFNGRARRTEYWMFALFNVIISIVLTIIDAFTGLIIPQLGVGLLSGLYSLAVFIPGLAVTVRRLHDTGRTGWWILIAFIPLIGALVLLVFMVLGSEDESNKYGDNPKAEEAQGALS